MMKPPRHIPEKNYDAASAKSAPLKKSGNQLVSEARGSAYTPKPHFPEMSNELRKNKRRLTFLAFISCIVLALGVGGVTYFRPGDNSPSKLATTANLQNRKTMAVADADINQELTAQARAELQKGATPSVLLPFSEKLRQEILNGESALYMLRIYDSADDDGDEVDLFIDGAYFAHLVLSNAGNTLTIPLNKHQTTTVRIVASRDGQGGVTMGAYSSLGETRTRVMSVGESEEWQISYR